MLFASALLLLFALLWLLFLGIGPGLEHVLGRAAHRLAAFRHRDYLPVALVLIAGLAIALFAGDAFFDIAEEMRASSPELAAIDANVHAWARLARTDGSTKLFVPLTLIGTPVGVGILVAIIAAILVSKGHWRWALYLILTSGVGGLINLAIKDFFERARPELAEALRQAHGYSFPSGHAMGSTIFFGALSYLALRTLHRWRWRAAALAFAVTMIAAISASRIYLGVHWISDIAAGIAAGLIWITTTTVAYETFRRIRRVREMRARSESPAVRPSP